MSETPQEVIARWLASPSSGAAWEIGVREAIRAVLEELAGFRRFHTEMDLAVEYARKDEQLRIEDRVLAAEAERDELRAEVERLKDRISRLGLQRGAQQIRAEQAEARDAAMKEQYGGYLDRAEKAEAALRECLIQQPHEDDAPKGCLCRWCKARALLKGHP